MQSDTHAMIATLRVDAPLAAYQQLKRWATSLGQRQWAVENTRVLGGHLAQRRVRPDLDVIDRSGSKAR